MFRMIVFLLLIYLGSAFQPKPLDYHELTTKEFVRLVALQQPVNVYEPDYKLLDATIFHLTNQERMNRGLKPLSYAVGLHLSAQNFAKDMIQMDFYGHNHPYSPALATLNERVGFHTWEFPRKSENIGQYQVIDTPEQYCCRRKRDGSFEYMDCDSKHLFYPYTYEKFAQYAVDEWLNSPPHRRAMLDSTFTHMGCAARLSKKPYQACKAPYGRFVQNFGQRKESLNQN